MNLAEDPEAEERKAICEHIVQAWDIYLKCGALSYLEQEGGGQMTEQERKVFQLGWYEGFTACIMEGKVMLDSLTESEEGPF